MPIVNTVAIRLEAFEAGLRQGLDAANGRLNGFEKGLNKTADAFGRASNGAKKFAGAADATSNSFAKFIQQNRTVGDVTRNLVGFISGLNPVLAVGAVAVGVLGNALANVTKRSVAFGEELQAVAQRTSFSVEALSQLKFVVEQNNSSFDALKTGLRVFNRNLGAAIQGSAEATKLFKQLGVSQEELKRSSPEEVLNRVSDGLKNIGSTAVRTNIGLKAFGRGSESLLPILAQGSEALAEGRRQADLYGATISTRFSQQADEFSDNLAKIKTIQQGLAIQIGQVVVPALNQFLVTALPVAREALPLLAKGLSGSVFAFSKFIAVVDLVSASIFKLQAVITRDKFAIEAADEATIKAINTLKESKEAFDRNAAAALKNVPALREVGEVATEAVPPLAAMAEALEPLIKTLEGGSSAIEKAAESFLQIGTPRALAQYEALIVKLTRLAAAGDEAAESAARALIGAEGPVITPEQREERERLGFEPPTQGAIGAEGQLQVGPPAPSDELLQARAQEREEAEFVGPRTPDEQGLITVQTAVGEINVLFEEQAAEIEKVNALAVGFGDTLVDAALGAKGAFGDFFKGLAIQLAKAIAKAAVLASLLSLTGLGGGLGFGKLFSKVLNFDDPGADSFALAEGRRFGMLFGRGARVGSEGNRLGIASNAIAQAPSVNPVTNVNVYDAGPLAKIEFTDRAVIPRLRQRLRTLGEEPFTR